MSLIDKKSLFDRNTNGTMGDKVGTTLPEDGGYFQDYGNSSSPFLPGNSNSNTVDANAPKDFDHMVHLLTKPVASRNSGGTYLPSPSKSEFQDFMNTPGTDYPEGNGALGQFGGPYKHTGPADGFY
tara:strand:+ start:807 stop:1184 length:378 start_codon:yes stop_codon:yes gene_type:complete